ncbi:MAG TPA: hypothetical protein PLM74_03580 [Bacillota bacterium]|jgi:hypothetical protein|nr:hypothetical protein [Bacillota bacterium]
MITIPFSPRHGRNRSAIVRVALVLAFAVLTAWGMHANCQEECSLVVQGRIAPAVSIYTSPDLIEWNDLYPGTNDLENAVTVTMLSNVDYEATISCSTPYMKGPGLTELLTNPLEWKCSGGDYRVISVAPATIRLGGPSASGGDSELISFRQVVEYSDPPLDNPAKAYVMTVRFAIEPRL